MTNANILPIGFIAVMLTLSGTAIATAQNGPFTSSETPAVETAGVPEMLIKADHRGRERGRNSRGMSLGALLNDADGDGTITADEIDLARSALIAGADANGNGDISLEEYQTIFVELMRDRMVDGFQNLDADGSGEITTDEVDAAIARITNRMDRNDDGVLNADDQRGRDRT